MNHFGNGWSRAGIACVWISAVAAGYAASTGSPFYGDPPNERHPWAVHDQNRPQPPVVAPGTFSTPDRPGRPPSDAVVLFDGTDLSQWESDKNGGAPSWPIRDGCLESAAVGMIRTKAKFGDCQLHIEWAAPSKVEGDSQGRGNSGVFLMGLVEIQVLDCYQNPTYADGSAGSVYGVNPPLANAVRPPGEFQVYDIVFRRPLYKGNQVLDPGYVTVFVNGVLVQDHTPLEGPTGHMARSKPQPFPEQGPLKLQDHGNPVRFRNIWYRSLPPRSLEGGTDGVLSTEATMAKRKEIATAVRQDAATLRNSSGTVAELMRLMESLVYEKDAPTYATVEKMAGEYVAGLKALPADQLSGKRNEVRNFNGALKYLLRCKIVPETFGPLVETDRMIKEQGWDRRRRQ